MRRQTTPAQRLGALRRAALGRWPLALLLGGALLLPRAWWDAGRLATLGALEQLGEGRAAAQDHRSATHARSAAAREQAL